LVCLADGIVCFVGFQKTDPKLILASQSAVFFIESTFLLIWGVSLVMLNRKVKRNNVLMPNATMFCLHGTVLSAFLLLFLVYLLIFVATSLVNSIANPTW